MKNILLCTLLLSFSVYSQKLEKNESLHISEDFIKGQLNDVENVKLENFNSFLLFKNKLNGLNHENYLTTKSGTTASIEVTKENIGRIVIYATTVNEKDSILYVNPERRSGEITIRAYRKNSLLTDSEDSYTTNFEYDSYKQIDFDFHKSSINKIEIIFKSEKDLFLIEKLRVIPFNENGINYYDELEKDKKEIVALQKNYKKQAESIKDIYLKQLTTIEFNHKQLDKIIHGEKLRALSVAQSNSLNPFRDDGFIEEYGTILAKANDADRIKIETISDQLKNNKISEVAKTIDDIFLGSRFTSLISLVDNLFSKNIKLDNPLPVLYVGDTYYSQTPRNGGSIKLVPIEDEELNKVKELNNKNKAFKMYVEKLSEINLEDAAIRKNLLNVLLKAESLKKDYELYLLKIVNEFSKEKDDLFVNNKGINISMSTIRVNNFQPDRLRMKEFQPLKKKSILYIEEFKELEDRYTSVIISVKSSYNRLFEKNPTDRIGIFDSFDLPNSVKSNWNENQKNITAEYNKASGIKDILLTAAGTEK